MDEYAAAGGRATPAQMGRKHVYGLNGSPEFLRALLQDESYNVTTTNFVPNSFSTIEAAQPDLLIIDLIHGEKAGWDLLRALRTAASTTTIPVVLASTDPRLLDEAQAQRAAVGGDRYLVKPFGLDELVTTIAELIGTA